MAYSIDESFIGLHGTVNELTAIGHDIRAEVLPCTEIPVRVGIARSKAHAKLASRGTKADLFLGHLGHLGDYDRAWLDRIMAGASGDIAGRTGKRPARRSIFTAKDLRDADAKWIRKEFSVVMDRTVHELCGAPCIPLEEQPPRTRSSSSSPAHSSNLCRHERACSRCSQPTLNLPAADSANAA